MNRQVPQSPADWVAQLGEPHLVCRISRKTLFWVFAAAVAPGVLGIVVLAALAQRMLAAWSQDLFGSVIFLAVGVASLWCGQILWRKANRLRHVWVAVYEGGVSYHDGSACLTCPWDQIEQVRWRVSDHYEKWHLQVGLIPVPGIEGQKLSHTTYEITLERKDGVRIVFTNEFRNVAGLARAIHEGINRNIGTASYH